ncbi:MAG TPA: amino acid adenylation domain-containing protein, partial [Ktedonobacteraceae bacterium]
SLNLSIFNRLPLHPQVNNIVGDFTSLIVLAIEHSADTFEQRARCIQEQLWSDLDHSIYSGVRVLRELGRRQGNMATGVMPIVFTSLLIEDMANQLPPPWQETLYCVSQTPQVWLDHQVLESGGTLIMHWQTVEALFPPGVVEAMFTAYCQLLQHLATDEETWQASFIPLVPTEQIALYAQTNATDVQQEPCLLQELFIRQVSRNPEQLAVITSQRALSYAEVYAGSLPLAYQLRQLGVRPNQLVGIVMEKGWEQVVAALGILQSGAAYLPIDPETPEERLYYLLEHSNVKIVLTQSFLAQRINWPDNLEFLYVDTLELQNTNIIELEAVQTPQDLAYVIYTSGSTGQPKGVMIDHCGAINTILDINERFHVGPHDRVLALSAFTFDLSVYDIFGLLAAGGTIVLPDTDAARDPMAWLELLAKERVTIWNTVPALLQMLVEFAQEQGISPGTSLRLALLSGDWIPLTLPEQLKTLVPGVEVISLGGATEASIWSIFYPIGNAEPSWKSIPYGRPLRNQHFYVLNESLDPCPLWVTGHLYIGGIGLAQGYWGDAEKTQASFLLHPRTRERLYKTGDLGRYLPDGTIEFLGREDFQVKIQGYRIELGEIESVLGHHPKIQEVIVTAVGETRGEKRLVAYVVCLPACALQIDELRQFLEERLPGYMMPSNFIFLERLPLTSNGKVDRKALPMPEQNETQQQGTSLEETALVAQIRHTLSSILKVEHIDPHKSLLDYGATSLDVLRITNQLQSQLHVRLYAGQLYRYTTLAALAQYCERVLSEGDE